MITTEDRLGLNIELLDHANAEAPREACGLIVSKDEKEFQVWRGQNIAEGEHEYLLDPKQQHDFMRRIEEDEDLQLEAIYHSHPRGPADLSERDKSLRFWPCPLVIVSLDPLAIVWR
jgi:proteasome lid subunit RPN8/RPN11